MPQAASSAQHLSSMQMSQSVPPSLPHANQSPSQFGAPPVPVVPLELLVALLGDVLQAMKTMPQDMTRR